MAAVAPPVTSVLPSAAIPADPNLGGKFYPVYVLRSETKPSAVPDEQGFTDGTNVITIDSRVQPFTCEFSIVNETFANAQTATIRIKNLGPATRRACLKAAWNQQAYQFIEFYAGYSSMGAPLVFNGLILQCTSWRDGVDVVTEWQATSLFGIAPSNEADFVVPAGSTLQFVLQKLNQAMPGASPNPVIGPSFAGITIPRAFVQSGKVWSNIRQASNGLGLIDNGTLKVLNDNEAAQSTIAVINNQSGIIGTPRFLGGSQIGIEVTMLFEPRFTLQQIVQLESLFDDNLNGLYKVYGFRHQGIISPRVAGDRTTTVTLFRPPGGIAPIPVAPLPALP